MKSGPNAIPILILLLSSAGCSWVPYACNNLVTAPLDTIQNRVFLIELHHQACSAWKKESQGADATAHSQAYVTGFEDGFVDYVAHDGTGDAPATPPLHIRHVGCRLTVAPEAIQDWYAGFRHGVRVAQQSGLRERVVIPIGLPPRPTEEERRGEEASLPHPSVSIAPVAAPTNAEPPQ